MIMEWIQAFQGPLTCRTFMTHTFYIDATGVNGEIVHIVDQTNQCDSNPTNIGLLIWNGMLFMSKNIVMTAFVHR